MRVVSRYDPTSKYRGLYGDLDTDPFKEIPLYELVNELSAPD